MKHGIECETVAAQAYSKIINSSKESKDIHIH
jgi:hypothetical protein